jgi:thiamine-phosphate pyrophosphorylase
MALRTPLPTLYALTDLEQSGAPSHGELVRRLVDAGVRLVQLRDKSLPAGRLCTEAADAVRIATSSKTLLIVNDRVDIALAAGAGGVHLGGEDLPAVVARRLLGEDAVIGVSTHSPVEAVQASAEPVDYVAIGPIFASTTKPTGRTLLGLEAIRWVRSRSSIPIVAIGGITLERARDVREAGADSIAVIAGLYHTREDLRTRVGRFHEAIEAGSR